MKKILFLFFFSLLFAGTPIPKDWVLFLKEDVSIAFPNDPSYEVHENGWSAFIKDGDTEYRMIVTYNKQEKEDLVLFLESLKSLYPVKEAVLKNDTLSVVYKKEGLLYKEKILLKKEQTILLFTSFPEGGKESFGVFSRSFSAS